MSHNFWLSLTIFFVISSKIFIVENWKLNLLGVLLIMCALCKSFQVYNRVGSGFCLTFKKNFKISKLDSDEIDNY